MSDLTRDEALTRLRDTLSECDRLRAQLQAVEGALVLLEQAATEVHRKGAVGGAQWPKLAGALIRARAWTDTSRATLATEAE